jgi:hypothetical protein
MLYRALQKETTTNPNLFLSAKQIPIYIAKPENNIEPKPKRTFSPKHLSLQGRSLDWVCFLFGPNINFTTWAGAENSLYTSRLKDPSCVLLQICRIKVLLIFWNLTCASKNSAAIESNKKTQTEELKLKPKFT